MSLPTYAVFYFEEKKVASVFVNCGWHCSPESVTRVIKDIRKEGKFPDEWDKVLLYNALYTKEEIQQILLTDSIWQDKLY